MKRLCAFIICAIISVCIGAHMVNTKNEVEDESIQTATIKRVTTKPTEMASEVTKTTESQTKVVTTTNTTTSVEDTTENTTEKHIQDTTEPSTTQTPTTTTKPSTESKSEFYLSDYERSVVECIVMGEAGGETHEGQVLVAQCLLNACLKENLQPSEIRRRYQYSGWNSNPSESVKNAVSAVFDDGYKATGEFILYFYSTKYGQGQWHETQKFVCEVGDHRFFAEW